MVNGESEPYDKLVMSQFVTVAYDPGLVLGE